MALIGRPGLAAATPFTGLQTHVRALWSGSNRLFAVAGTHGYELKTLGNVDYGVIAGSAGDSPCTIIENGIQLLVMDPSVPGIFNFNGGTLTMVQATLTGVGGLQAVAMAYLDGFYFCIPTLGSLATSNPNQISNSNNGDGTTWDPLNYVIRTGAADLTTNLATLNGQLWIFGQKTIEIWYDAGNNGFPLARVPNATINFGLFSPYSVVKFSNTIMWIGGDSNGYPQVFMSQGMTPVKVSSSAVENYLSQQFPASTGAWWTAYGYTEAGHTFYVINLSGQSSYAPTGTQIVYDLTSGLWHRRFYLANATGNIIPFCFAYSPILSSGMGNFVGDYRSGSVFAQNIQLPSDGGNTILYKRNAPHLSNSNKAVSHDRFELSGDFGTAAPTLDWSNDGGRNYLGKNRALRQNQDTAIEGTFRRFFADVLGRSRDRVYSMSIVDNANLIRIDNAFLEIDNNDLEK